MNAALSLKALNTLMIHRLTVDTINIHLCRCRKLMES